MTDADGSGPVQRRPPRTTDGGAPVSGALAIILAIIAVVAGFLILRSISDGGDNDLGVNGEGGTDDPVEEVPDSTSPSSSTPAITTQPTEPPLNTTGAMVVVANANGTAGSAAAMSNALEAGPHFQVGDPENANAESAVIDASIIYFDSTQAAAQSVADSLNRVLGGDLSVLPLEGTPPVSDGDIAGAGVLLMLGTDKANKTLEELNPSATVAVVTNPAVPGTTGV